MKVETVRVIDRWIGIPLCWVCTVLDKAQARFRASRNNPTSRRHILFIELSEMGSAIIAYSAIRKAKALYPDADLYFLIFKANQESVRMIGAIPEAHVWTIDSRSPFRFVRDTLATLRKMRSLPIDAVIDLELFARFSTLLAFLGGAATRVGFHRFCMEGLYRGELLTHRVTYNVYQHMAFNFLNLVYALGRPGSESPQLKQAIADTPRVPHLPSTKAAKAAIFSKLQQQQPGLKPSDTLVILNPNAGLLPIRAWPLEKYVALARCLVRLEGLYIVIIGVGGAQRDAAAISEAVGHRCIDLVNRTTPGELIDLFNIADALVTNDSGAAHFASLTPIYNFVFFGPETPRLYAPLGKNTVVLYADFSCSPCLNAFNHRQTQCKDPQCVKSIPVQDVYDRILRALSPRPAKGP